MKLSFNWLKDFVAHGLSPEKLSQRLTMAGHEVKSIDCVGEDQVFEIEITPNRPDCLNTLGLAREVSAIVNKPLRSLKIKTAKIPKAVCDIIIEDRSACLRYVGAVIENILIGESPALVKQRLQAVGLRPINNVVDITNYGLFENGQPLHAFDFDKLIGGKIIVRRARPKEKIVTIDGVERELNPSILVIADAQRPVAIAGIMGGAETQVTSLTKRILLESAYFDPVLVRRAGRLLGLTSDSAYRFERGVDLFGVERCAKIAVDRILQTAGGNIVKYRDLFSKKKPAQKKFFISADEISRFLGEDISSARVKSILTRLEFSVSGASNRLAVSAPSFRADIKGAVDLCEEVGRIIGYDRLPASLPKVKPSVVASSPNFIFKRRLRRILTGQGVDEVISYPLISRAVIEKAKVSDLPVSRVKNPLSLDQEFLRPSLLPSLLAVVALNFNRGQKNLRLFEIGKVYPPDGEKEVLGVVLCGLRPANWQSNKKEMVDFYDLKGIVACVLEVFGQESLRTEFESMDIYSQDQSACLVFEGQRVATIGKVNKDVLRNWDIKSEDVYFAQLILEPFYKIKQPVRRFVALPEFPSISRDVSIAVSQEISFAQIEKLVREIGGGYLVSINFLEQYLGEKIVSGQKGLVFSLIYQSLEKTLTESEIAPIHERILQRLCQDLGATIR